MRCIVCGVYAEQGWPFCSVDCAKRRAGTVARVDEARMEQWAQADEYAKDLWPLVDTVEHDGFPP